MTATGSIELWCAPCAELGPNAPPILAPAPTVVAAIEPAPPRPVRIARVRRSRKPPAWVAVVGSGAVAFALTRGHGARVVAAAVPTGADVAIVYEEIDEPAGAAIAIPREVSQPRRQPAAPPTPAAPDAPVAPAPDADELIARYPSLAQWTHPVVDSPEPTPHQESRWFGAARVGIVPRAECGLGHCGVDLDGPRGRAIVSVAAGTVVRIERSELGRDKRSGRYVRVEHDDGTLTAYMHLDDIADGLEVGQRVAAGQQLGTLGATAVYHAAPHLHFSLALPDHVGPVGDNNDNHYTDPMPFLARATVISAAE